MIFDPVNKRIVLESASTSATEIYSRSCDWLLQGDNAKYGAVFRQVGSDDLGGGLSIPPYFFLQNTWRIRPMEQDHVLTVEGNLFVDGGGEIVVNTLGSYNVLVKNIVPVQAQGISTSGSTGLTPQDIESIVNSVWNKQTSTLTTSGTIGNFITKLLSVVKFLGLK